MSIWGDSFGFLLKKKSLLFTTTRNKKYTINNHCTFYMMDSRIDPDVWGLNSSVKDILDYLNRWFVYSVESLLCRISHTS